MLLITFLTCVEQSMSSRFNVSRFLVRRSGVVGTSLSLTFKWQRSLLAFILQTVMPAIKEIDSVGISFDEHCTAVLELG